MITENILLLAAILVLIIKMEWTKRPWFLALSMVFWFLARLLIERAYSSPTEYRWGSLEGFGAIVCWFFCLLSLFLACLPKRRSAHLEPHSEHAESHGERPAKKGEARLRELLHDH
jgi:hypothetical protein